MLDRQLGTREQSSHRLVSVIVAAPTVGIPHRG
jgi:hypothetical protein